MAGVERVALIGRDFERGVIKFLETGARRLSRFESWAEGLDTIEREGADLVLVKYEGGVEEEARIRRFMHSLPKLRLILVAECDAQDSALALYQAGAFEYIPASVSLTETQHIITKALDTNNAPLYRESIGSTATLELVGVSPAVIELRRALRQLARANVPVLLHGEPGTGKRLFARLLHQNGERQHKPYVGVNVSAISRSFLDVELFGLERTQNNDHFHVRTGRVEEAGEGSIFLDEIAELPLDVQIRLSQVLAESRIHRVGGQNSIPAPVRVIAATTQKLEQLVMNGQFQHELYHRLNVVRVSMPRLAERKEDIPLLAQHFFNAAAKEQKNDAKRLSDDVVRVLQQYDWPGNIRQLENLCKRLSVMVSDELISVEHLPGELRPELAIQAEARSWEEGLQAWAERCISAGESALLSTASAKMERTLLLVALKHTGGRKQDAASLLGWGRNTLARKMKELDVQDDEIEES